LSMARSLISNKPASIALCVGMFRLSPIFIRYPFCLYPECGIT
jgi:hypothetical protein